VNALSAYSAALRLAQLDTCKTGKICDTSKLSTGVIKALRSFNFPVHPVLNENIQGDSTVATNHELEGTRGRINHQGQLVSRKYDIYLSKKDGKMAQVLLLICSMNIPRIFNDSNLNDNIFKKRNFSHTLLGFVI